VVQANMELYFKYSYTALANLFSLVILILLGCAVLFVPFWKIFMQKIDKKYLFMIGNLTMVPLLFGGFFFGSGTTLEIVIFFLLSIMAANCFTSVFLIPWSMLPEVLDAYFIVYKTKPDAFFYTFFNLGSKVIMALYFGVTQIVLE
jgi:GPH family glycoside/pentoside/hexuronide:cation symporter